MYLGIDIGGTTARVSAFLRLGEATELGREEFPVTKQPNGDFEQDFDNLVTACLKLVGRYGRVEGIGLAIAGKIDATRSYLTGAGSLGHWASQPVARRLSEILSCHVVLGNDAEAAALAEAHYGHGRGSDFWFVIWGTGVGGCLVRHIGNGPVPLPGEPGHSLVNPHSTHQCGCGQYGCLEAYCGGAAIARRFGVKPENLTAAQWQEVIGWMKVGVFNIVTAQPVPLVVFGGGVANKQAALLDDLKGLLDKELRIVEVPEVQLSAFGESAGTIGALALLWMK